MIQPVADVPIVTKPAVSVPPVFVGEPVPQEVKAGAVVCPLAIWAGVVKPNWLVPRSFITSPIALLENLAVKIDESLVTEAEAVSVKAVLTVKLVAEAIAVTVRVSALTVILSPITNSVVNRVLVPTSVVLAVGSAVPVSVEDAFPVNLPPPATSRVLRGVVVPMPTLPLPNIVIAVVIVCKVVPVPRVVPV